MPLSIARSTREPASSAITHVQARVPGTWRLCSSGEPLALPLARTTVLAALPGSAAHREARRSATARDLLVLLHLEVLDELLVHLHVRVGAMLFAWLGHSFLLAGWTSKPSQPGRCRATSPAGSVRGYGPIDDLESTDAIPGTES